jgi:hypothetical protein
MQIKTSKLTGVILDWAVAKCEAEAVELISARMITERRHVNLTPEEVASLPAPKPYLVIPGVGNAAYSTNWSQGGPIIERECITLVNADGDDVWSAYPIADNPVAHRRSGSTPLIAAMRCYVASKMGDIVEIPDQLL